MMDRIGNRQLLGAAMARRAFLLARLAGRLLGIRLCGCHFLRGLGTVLFGLGILRTPLGAKSFVQLFFFALARRFVVRVVFGALVTDPRRLTARGGVSCCLDSGPSARGLLLDRSIALSRV
jgi:hypothetical protein